ncbi:MAG: carboxymuconolactone decarboxylase family protein [Deltaproteobacteria bacterium]
MYLPDIFKKFKDDYPEILDAYHKVGELCAGAGPMNLKTQHLVQLGIAIGVASKGGVRSHVRRALDEGASEEEIRQTVLISATMVGFPAMIAAYQWTEEVLGGNE